MPEGDGQRREDWRPVGRRRLRCARIVMVQSVKGLILDNGSHWAAAIAYYTLLSLFPLLLLVASLAAPAVDAAWAVDRLTHALGEFTPRGEDRIAAILREALEKRGEIGLGSTVALLWTGSRVFGALTKALNLAFAVDETYGVLRRRLVEVGMLLTLGLAFALALAAEAVIGTLRIALAPLPGEQEALLGVLQEAARLILLPVAFLLIYRFVPRGRPDWRAALAGAVTASLLFLVGEELFLDYLERFGTYNRIYGSLALAIVLVLWAWAVAVITLFGGEVAAHVQYLAIEGHAAAEVECWHGGHRRLGRAARAVGVRRRTGPPAPAGGGRRAADLLLVAGGILLGVCLARAFGRRARLAADGPYGRATRGAVRSLPG